MARLEGKVAIITGAASGIGAAAARLFVSEGAKVVIGDIQDEKGRSTAGEVGENALYVRLDVAQEADWQAAIEETVRRFGRLDVLVNNAGTGGSNPFAKIEDQTEEDWHTVMDVNARGVFLGAKFAIPEMRKVSGGSIVNISSIYGLVGAALGAPYPASKGAVRIFTKAAAIQYAADGIRVNSVHPGFIDTPQTAKMLSIPETRADLISRTPLGRLGTPEDIAAGILFLASDEASYITGAEFVMDGGITAQ